MTIFALTLIPLQASAQIMPPNTVPHLITIRKQDLETMKRLQQEKEKMRDYNNRQVNKEGKVGHIRNQLCAGFQQVFQPIVLM